MILTSQLHKRIQMSIKPQLRASQIIKVKGETLSKQEAIEVWTGYLAAQVSWHGPKTPEQILQGIRNKSSAANQPGNDFDDEAHAAAAKEVKELAKAAS